MTAPIASVMVSRAPRSYIDKDGQSAGVEKWRVSSSRGSTDDLVLIVDGTQAQGQESGDEDQDGNVSKNLEGSPRSTGIFGKGRVCEPDT